MGGAIKVYKAKPIKYLGAIKTLIQLQILGQVF